MKKELRKTVRVLSKAGPKRALTGKTQTMPRAEMMALHAESLQQFDMLYRKLAE